MIDNTDNMNGLGVSSKDAIEVGIRLQKARLQRGFDILFLAGKIKIREHYAAAIESGSWNELPPGVNGRGLIRLYAKELAVSLPELEAKSNSLSTLSYEEVIPAFAVVQRSSLAGKTLSDASLELARSIPRGSTHVAKAPSWNADEAPIATQDVIGMLGLDQYFDGLSQDVPKVTAESVAADMFSTPKLSSVPATEVAKSENRKPNKAAERVSSKGPNPTLNKVPEPALEQKSDLHLKETPVANIQVMSNALKNLQNEPVVQKSSKRMMMAACIAIGLVSVFALSKFQNKRAESTVVTAPVEDLQPEAVNSEVPMEAGAVSLSPVTAKKSSTEPINEAANEPSTVESSNSAESNQPVVVVPDEPIVKGNKAELRFSAPVQISVVVDGKKIFDGVSAESTLPISFAKSAEILVEDGSLVSLKFGNWDHGPLGHEGRKRRVTLYPNNF